MQDHAQTFQQLLGEMNSAGASDLFLTEGKPPVRRMDGALVLMETEPVSREMLEHLLESALRPEQRERFERSGDLDFGLSLPQVGRFRLNLHRQMGLLGVAVRRVPPGNVTLEELRLPEEVRQFAELQSGLVLVVGPTGSGKSSTMASMVHHINSHFRRHIVTIEDPVEFVHEDRLSLLTQREVGSDTADFASALKHALRENPDVLLIGEMRDAQTVNAALSAALTGHLVISSLHTTDAVQTINRILSFYPEHLRRQVCLDLSVCLRGVLAQRLLPRLDAEGRVAAVEVLTNSPAAQKLLRDGRLEDLPELLLSGAGMRSFNQSLLALFEAGVISIETGAAAAPDPDDFRLHVNGMERGTTFAHTETDSLPSVGGLEMRSLLHSANRHGASDIHLTAGSPPVFRIHGNLWPLESAALSGADVRRLLFSLLSRSQREQFELEKELDFAISLAGNVRFRVNAHYQRGTIAVAMRLIPGNVPPRESLGLPEVVTKLAEAPQGLILVTGPTGSGKSTTLATLVDILNSTRNCRIITIEDPIEFVHYNRTASIVQREVGADTRSFAAALKYILRQDPDVVLVGEMRDLETIQAALTAAETGHLVMATLHTNDAPQAIDRVIDVFPPHQQEQVRSQLAASLLAVVSQRLLLRKEGVGRVAAFEVLLASPAVRAIIREGKTHQLIGTMEISMREGMQTLDHALELLFQEGHIAREEALRYMRNTSTLPPEPPAPNAEASAPK